MMVPMGLSLNSSIPHLILIEDMVLVIIIIQKGKRLIEDQLLVNYLLDYIKS